MYILTVLDRLDFNRK